MSMPLLHNANNGNMLDLILHLRASRGTRGTMPCEV